MKQFIKDYWKTIVVCAILIACMYYLSQGCNKQYTEPEINWYDEKDN